MKRWKLGALTLVITAALCTAVYFALDFYLDRQSSEAVSLWYIQGDVSEQRLLALKKEYNRAALSGELPLSVKGFDSEEAMAAEFNTSRPDLLLCPSIKAEDLKERGLLSESCLTGAAYPENIMEVFPDAGRSFFPVGSDVTVLLMNKKLCEASNISMSYDSLDALFGAAYTYTKSSGTPFFTAHSYGDLLSAAMCALDEPFYGELRKDAETPLFGKTYNLLARCGYVGGLSDLGSGSAAAVAEGKLPAASVFLSELDDMDGEGLCVTLLPLPKGGKAACPAELFGLALTCGDSTHIQSASAFLQWFQAEGKADELAAASALVPMSAMESTGDYYWGELLSELSRDYELRFILKGSGFTAGRDEFNSAFSAALDLLS